MQENTNESPSLIKLGKLANNKDFGKLEDLWPQAVDSTLYSWRELLPIAGQVGRQGSTEKALTLIEMLISVVEEKQDSAAALEVARAATGQLKKGEGLRNVLLRLYQTCHPEFSGLSELLDRLIPRGAALIEATRMADLYLQLQPGCYALDRGFLVPGVVEELTPGTGWLSLRFDDRHSEYDPSTATKLTPLPRDHFPAQLLYNPEALKDLALDDAVAYVKLAMKSNREGRLQYRYVKSSIIDLLGEKGWKEWWQDAKRSLKRDPLIGMTPGSQPTFRILRQADRFEDRVLRKFDHAKSNQEKLLEVMAYLDEISREEKQGGCENCADDVLLVHLGNGAAKTAVAVLKDNPTLALAGLALHAEVAARGVDVARPNPRAAAQVLARVTDQGEMVAILPEALLQRVLIYLRGTLPDGWGKVWSAVLVRSGKRMCDVITRGLIEGGQADALEKALLLAIAKPSASPDLLGWLWRTSHTASTAGKFLAGLENLTVRRIADAMFSLLHSTGTLYGLSMEEKHLKVLESSRAAFATQNNQPLLTLLEEADRTEAKRLKIIIEKNAGLSASHRTQLLGLLRAKYADIFLDLTREWEDGTTVYTTEQGLRITQDALNTIIKDELPEVAKQIGEAASFGDLSENAEFTAALEKRDQLASRATGLESELSLASVITPEMANSDFVNIGTRVRALAADSGEEVVFTFLGPWDTDTDQLILNYQAPLSLAFMGSKVGDRVVFGEESESRSWEILGIEPAV
ncbi:MAG: GreA/GreB family elongation factor [Gemmatimonadales bacterium]|nr:GreA/GreB family elongation factor [Gemmatimonadales bacterium]